MMGIVIIKATYEVFLGVVFVVAIGIGEQNERIGLGNINAFLGELESYD